LYADTGRESAKALAEDGILSYRDEIATAQEKRRVHDDDWDYLQLAAVWVRHLLKDSKSADNVVEFVAKGRPFSFGMFSGSGKYGWGAYGYPNIYFMGSDFRLLVPQNVVNRLSEGVHKNVKRWQELLMNPDHLKETYEKIEEIREPIRQEFLEQIKKE